MRATMNKLKTFSGASHENVKHWVRSVDLVSVGNSWDLRQKLCSVCALLVGKAAVWLDTQSLEAWKTWQDFSTANCDNFSESEPEDLLQQIMEACQHVDEDARDFLQRFSAVAGSPGKD